MNMFEIDEAIRGIYDNATVNEETGEVEIHIERLDLLTIEKSKKVEHLLMLVKEKKAEIDSLGELIKSLQAKKAVATNKLDRIKNFLVTCDAGKYGHFKLALKHTKQVILNGDIDDIPEEYIRIKKELDKTSAKEFLEKGMSIPGLELKDNVSAVIK